MREIKFRAKTNDGVQWVHGSLINASPDKPVLIEEYDGLRRISPQYLVDPDTVGQFTGLRDSKGKEIYEGDIVRWTEGDEENVLVVWRAGEFDVDLSTGPCCIGALACLNPFADDGPRLTVIGNVHDNPELLEVEHD